MIILEKVIEIQKPSDTIRLIPFGCVHADTDGFHEGLWKECLAEIAEPNTYAFGCGDYLDAVRTHARDAIDAYRLASKDKLETLDKYNLDAYKDFYKRYFKPIETKLMMLGEGNHLWNFASGITSDQYLCQLAGCDYGGKPTFIRLRIKYMGKILKTLTILVHHGDWSGGYARMGTDVGAAEAKALSFGEFDLFFFSHTHRKYSVPLTPALYLPTHGELRLVERPRQIVRTGCFTRSYDVKCLQHYAHKKLLPPTELGFCIVKVQLYRDYDSEKYQNAREQGMTQKQAKGYGTSLYKHRFKVEV